MCWVLPPFLGASPQLSTSHRTDATGASGGKNGDELKTNIDIDSYQLQMILMA